MKLDAVPNLQPIVKVEQVGAATEQHVLAIVDSRTVFVGAVQRIRSCPATEKGAGLKYRHFLLGGTECDCCGETRKSAADNGNTVLAGQSVKRSRPLSPRARTALSCFPLGASRSSAPGSAAILDETGRLQSANRGGARP
jgi:hypothetical protein